MAKEAEVTRAFLKEDWTQATASVVGVEMAGAISMATRVAAAAEAVPPATTAWVRSPSADSPWCICRR